MLNILDDDSDDPDIEAKTIVALDLMGYLPDKKISWPIGLATLADILRRAGFRTDTDSIAALCLCMGRPLPREGWHPSTVHNLICMLHNRRDWLPGHFDDKKDRLQLCLDEARKAGVVDAWSRCFFGDLKQNLLLLLQADDREKREQFFAAVLAKLEVEHGVVV